MKNALLLVTHGLIDHQDGLTLHPDLFLWEQTLLKRKRRWFASRPHNPLSLYAALVGTQPAHLLASKLTLSASVKQYWIASPYHAQLTRDAIRVMPEEILPWCEDDAAWMCELLNPLLSEEGMKLEHVGASLLLTCEQALHANPLSFADITGNFLPNKHPAGEDAGHLMRLMSEIQMTLNQSPAQHRRIRGDMDVHGLWFWGACKTEQDIALKPINIASKNPFLQALIEPKDAKIIITEPENLSHLVRQGSDLPKKVFLLGEKVMVCLNQTWLFHPRQQHWQTKNIRSEKEGLAFIHPSNH
ncbi:MAG: threonine synthase [Mariprofundaceae bacterium]|nr:threonine synthase [Mariprofundaceae bacterium]